MIKANSQYRKVLAICFYFLIVFTRAGLHFSWHPERRFLIRSFKCRECKILPLCGGGCTPQAIEHGNVDYCVYGFDEDIKTQTIMFISSIQ